MHRYKTKVIILVMTSLAASACSFFKSGEAVDENIQRSYFPDGKLHKEITMKDGVKTGIYKEYFNNGQLFEEVNFINNKREGLDKKF